MGTGPSTDSRIILKHGLGVKLDFLTAAHAHGIMAAMVTVALPN
jgi:hypothetical protein